MKSCIALLAIVCGAIACDYRCQWTSWKAKYGKTYTASEEEYRFGVFKENLADVARLERENPEATFGATQFSDLTHAEFRARYATFDVKGMKRSSELHNAPEARRVSARALATNYVSPYTTPAQNQGQCGSCWAFASCGMAEANYKQVTGSTVVCAPQQLVDCSTQASGCNGGNYQSGIGWIVSQTTSSKGGAALMSAYAYKGTQGTCKSVTGSIPIASYAQITFNEAVNAGGLDNALQQYGPMGIALDADSLQSYTGGVLSSTSTCTDGVNHAVLLVGWATISGTQAWVVKNSWGSTWGVTPDSTTGWDSSNGGGFFYIKRDTTNTGSSSGTCLMSKWGAYYSIGKGGSSTCVAMNKSKACGTAVCGTASDGCGGTVTCGTCTSSQTCSSGVCSTSTCTPYTTANCGSQCGTFSDGCGGTLSCTCSSGYTCSSGQCLAPSCTAKTASAACGTKVCGSVSDGCAGSVSCGTCTSGTCTSSGTCSNVSPSPTPASNTTSSSWTQYVPSGTTNSFSVSSGVVTATSGTAEARAKWVGSESLGSTTWESFSAMVSITAGSTAGVGLRLQGGTSKTAQNGLVVKVARSTTGTATLSYCMTYWNGVAVYDQCSSMATFTYSSAINLTIVAQNKDSSTVAITPYVNSMGVYSSKLTSSGTTAVSTSLSDYASVGQAFLTVLGSATFSKLSLVTRSAVNVALSSCNSASALQSYASQLLNIPTSSVLATTATGSACSRRADSGETLFKEFLILLTDASHTRMLGADYVLPGASVENFQPSSQLATQLSDILTSGNPSLLGYDVSTATVSTGLAVEATTTVEVTTTIVSTGTSGLSAGAIAGIAVGASVGGLAVLGAVGAGVYVVASKSGASEEVEVPAEFQPYNPFRKSAYRNKVKRGVDVINPSQNHGSITARAPPVA